MCGRGSKGSIGTDEFPRGLEIPEKAFCETVDYLGQRKDEERSSQSKRRKNVVECEEEMIPSEDNKDNRMSAEDEEDEDEVLPTKSRRKMRKRRVIYPAEGEELESPVEMADSSSQSENTGKRRISTPDSIPEKKKKKNKNPTIGARTHGHEINQSQC